jgi:hypothetical protein
MPYKAKTDHELDWGDKEIRYMLKRGLKATHIYRLMGYEGRVPTPAFKKRLERLASSKEI